MSELATLKTEGDVSIITLDDGKANVFSYPMLETLQKILSEIPKDKGSVIITCLLYTSPSPRDKRQSRMPSSA